MPPFLFQFVLRAQQVRSPSLIMIGNTLNLYPGEYSYVLLTPFIVAYGLHLFVTANAKC